VAKCLARMASAEEKVKKARRDWFGGKTVPVNNSRVTPDLPRDK